MTVQIASGMAGRQLTGTSSCFQSSEDSSVPDGSIRAQDGRLLVRLMVVHRVASDLFSLDTWTSFLVLTLVIV